MLNNLHNGEIERAAKWATALLVRRSMEAPCRMSDIGREMDATLREHAPDYHATTPRRWMQYANGVALNLGNGEAATNRRWSGVPDQVKGAAYALADAVESRINACGPVL